jgi:hypothetical protein
MGPDGALFFCGVDIMTIGTVRTQGTELFFVNPLGSDPVISKLACPTGITGLGGPADQIESTCLDTVGEKTFASGLKSPGQVSVPFNLIPRDTSHQDLFRLKETGDVLSWLAALSESTTDPTEIDSDDQIVPPTDRTSFGFQAYISDVNIDIATNEIVRGTLTLQRSGPVTPTWYTPT